MKNLLKLQLVILMLIGLLCINQTYAQPTPPAGWLWDTVPSLTDEFDSWDDSKWFKPLWNYGEPVQMKAENSGVTDGKLWIKATLGTGDRWFETSRVQSSAQIKFPMYTEASLKTAHISAYSTYWLNNGDINNRDEIDIIEHNTKPSYTDQTDRPYTMYSQYFIVKNSVEERHHGNFDNRDLSSGNPAKGVKWNEEFQTLGCWWKDEHNVQFYINGEEAGSVQTTQEFTLSQSIIWDLWTIDATWSGGIADKDDLLVDSINTYYIDWIHTYKLELEPPGDNTFIITDSSSTVESSENIRVSVNYIATENLELIAELYDPSNTLLYDDMETTTEGFGKETLTISPDSPLPVANGYKLDILLRPIGDSDSICYSDSYTINVIADPISSVTSSTISSLNVYPNPAQNNITLTGMNEIIPGTEVSIYSIEGKTVLTKQLTDNQDKVNIDVSNLSPGIYFIKLKGYPNSGTKFIKR